MIIRKVKLTNFGIYSREHEFDLTPLPSGNFNRPVILFRGQNGVGKTTLVEAIRLCLHGSLVLGSRVGKREFDEYLAERIHHHGNGIAQPSTAAIEMAFEYVNLGQRITYRVARRWEKQAKRLVMDVSIWEDGTLLSNLDDDQKENFLRELVPPSVIDLFFFDGEKIQTLAEDSDYSDMLLAETVKSLLGLDMVELLGKDLDIYIARQDSHGNVAHLQEELNQLSEDEAVAVSQVQEIGDQLHRSEEQITEIKRLITAQEQKIASEGGRFAAKREARLAQKHRLETEIETQRRLVHELCNGLMPFAITPRMLQAIATRLDKEKEYERELAAQQVIINRIEQLEVDFVTDQYWQEIGLTPKPEIRQAILEKIKSDLQANESSLTISLDEIILHVTDKEKGLLLNWIDQALDETPKQFSQVMHNLSVLEQELKQTKDELSRVPAEKSLQPLLTHLNQLHHQLGALEKEKADLLEQLQSLKNRLEQIGWQKRRVREQIAEKEAGTGRVYLATKVQNMLEAYESHITRKKVIQLETLLVNRFNQLCRKKTFLDKVEVNPKTFQITLYRLGKRISRQQLSAGEKQLFAIATLWALREVSGRPMPIIIDTPLSRLDNEHRLSMTQEFFPHISHQLIILGTGTEVDDALSDRLQPAISHIYHLHYDSDNGTTVHERESPSGINKPLIKPEGIPVL